MPSVLASGLAGVATTLSAAGSDLTSVIPAAAGVAIGIGLLAFGIRYIVNVFKSVAH